MDDYTCGRHVYWDYLCFLSLVHSLIIFREVKITHITYDTDLIKKLIGSKNFKNENILILTEKLHANLTRQIVKVKSSMARSLPVENLLPQNVGSIINYLQ